MMINSAVEWLEIFGFALLVGLICALIVIIALVMGCWYCVLAVWDMDFKRIIE